MRIGAALFLIALGAILRFAISTVSTHGVAIHTIGDILMAVGVLGLILAVILWAPWRSRDPVYRDRDPVYRDDVPPEEVPPARTYRSEERTYRREYPYEDEYRR